ncbi:MAG TPA: 1-deoxy-D-xylulose-5-phosphate reductoisomerase [Syntrophaceae bacterium]|nr:1-deoxy-D-xylulose-5-phosphate reductoisomerase [Syntrophaceae bacterium]
MKKISLLGSTGSIGTSVLKVVDTFRDRFVIIGLAAGRNTNLLAEQIIKFRPKVVSVAYRKSASRLKSLLPRWCKTEILTGMEGCATVATLDEANLVVSAIQGSQGLIPTYSAIKAGKDIALATKEVLVMAGELLMNEVRKNSGTILPIDSEHSAIFQAISGHEKKDIKKVILTASGGPFLHHPLKDLASVTPKEALMHPKWQMGKKVSIDSASLMNKGLEAIEAHWLFNIPMNNIEIVIHPQSIIHSMVEYIDGTIMAQLSTPDMRIPIAYALSYPERLKVQVPPLNLIETGKLTFLEPDYKKFPCIKLAYEAMDSGGTMPIVLNAADEVAVNSFLEGRIRFTEIPTIIRKTMESHKVMPIKDMEEIQNADRWARQRAEDLIRGIDRG